MREPESKPKEEKPPEIVDQTPSPAPEPVPVPPPEPAPRPEVFLSLVAAAPLGAELTAPVAGAFLRSEKLSDIQTESVPGEASLLVHGRSPDGGPRRGIVIREQVEDVKLDCLTDNSTDAVISFRRARERERTLLKPLGDFSSRACEEVIALDALAVVAHKGNQIETLTTQQLRSILRAELTQWEALGGPSGAIRLHLPPESSAAVEALKEVVAGTIPRLPNDRRYDSPLALSDAVAADPFGIGLVPFRHLRTTKAIAVGDEEVKDRLIPSAFSVATESYRLTQRIYLHHAQAPTNTNLVRFLAWLISVPGQEAVEKTGYVDLNLRAESRPLPTHLRSALPPELDSRITSTEAVDCTIFFAYDSFDLDNRALSDLDRIAPFLSRSDLRGRKLILFGHADNRGTDAYNLELSVKRAMAVQSLLAQRGINPAAAVGLGKQLPVMSNDSETGMARNRRVELWLVETK
jgi:phosphate transport system substrate-binding protein